MVKQMLKFIHPDFCYPNLKRIKQRYECLGIIYVFLGEKNLIGTKYGNELLITEFTKKEIFQRYQLLKMDLMLNLLFQLYNELAQGVHEINMMRKSCGNS